MKILQLSDLHLLASSDICKLKSKCDLLYESISKDLVKNEKLIIITCGDIINAGDDMAFSIAEQLYEHLRDLFSEYKTSFEFVPGNHEISKSEFLKFDEFSNKYNESDVCFSSDNVVIKKNGDLALVLLNSAFEKDLSYGSIDILNIKKKIKSLKTKVIWVVHHTLFSHYDEDTSAIRNSYSFFEIIDKTNSVAVLHGHTHGYSKVTIGDDCKIIGVGPMFKEIIDVNNQINLINFNGTSISEIFNYRYFADLKKYNKVVVFENENKNQFLGTDLHQLYGNVVNNTKESKVLNNLKIRLTSSFSEFDKSIESMFSKEMIDAEKWLQNDLPNELYYNHAQFINKSEIDGIEYIKNELKEKATSSRAIISLINMKDITNSKDHFLPSLDVIQFGFDADTRENLIISVYMRALEVNHFLKINLCEIAILIRKLKECFRSISKVDLTITSFRAQYKEEFNCFKKARIDSDSPQKISFIVFTEDLRKIIEYLDEKRKGSETIIDIDGIINLKKAISEIVDSGNNCIYDKSITLDLTELIRVLETLKDLRMKTSINSELEILELKVKKQYSIVLKKLENLEGNKSGN